METKTNVMRILEAHKAVYKSYSYIGTGALSGAEVAAALGQNPDQVFKTLVTLCSKSKKHHVFMIPVEKELDLKKAAAAVGEKNIEMIKSKELLPTTGYVHGGCSPIGLKKPFPVTIDKTAENFATIIFSAGKIGYQVETSLSELQKVIDFTLAAITE